MAFDTNGTFNRLFSWKAHATAGTKIRADYHDDEDDGFASGLSNCITKDGRTQPTADIPMNGRHIINLGEPRAGQPQDAATKNYVDTYKAFTQGISIDGAGPINGFITFSSLVGVNGIGWANADMSWIGRVSEASKTRKRLAVNDGVDGLGTDVCTVDEGGMINNSGYLTNNLSYDGAWRTILPGVLTSVTYLNGAVSFASNDVASTTAYQSVTPRNFFTVGNSDGNIGVALHKSATGKQATITSYTGAGSPRWQINMGNVTAESGGNAGSDFGILSFNDGNTSSAYEIFINRATHETSIGGNLITGGRITTNQGYFQSAIAGAVLSANVGVIRIRPRGPDNGDRESYFHPEDGCLYLSYGGVYSGVGYRGKYGMTGGYDGYWHNHYYTGGFEYVLVNDTLMGAITWQSDYRIKRNVRPLDSMWEKVKSLNPIKYNHAKFREFVEDDDVERWGMFAHELQEKLVDSAAIGHKDEDKVIQSVNPLTVIAALTKALQEAMLRIEALEARAPA
jgi:hypothetical protein